jgi:hypothetical protein
VNICVPGGCGQLKTVPGMVTGGPRGGLVPGGRYTLPQKKDTRKKKEEAMTRRG